MKCPYCYNEQADNSEFCEKCGARLKAAENNPYTGSNGQAYPNNNQQQYNPYGQQQQPPQQPYSPYQQPGGYAPPPASGKSGMATAGLVMGILAVVCAGVIFGVLGLIFSIMGMNQLKKQNAPAGKAIAGLVLSIIGIVLWIIILSSGALNSFL